MSAAMLGQLIGVIGAYAITTTSLSLLYSVVKYLKLYRKAIRGRDLALQEQKRTIDT
ncbi:hypothetical protein [Bartonella saheliensis]|uniref:hypothetical protein n=1 Tax=Bartonella saheliensis TaxID=1457016 RepID=UPI001408CB29|nr:hypothetical protein [Bartonella saheliensis]